nr:anti-sigma factor [Pedobacter sp. SYSU D00382]
MNVHEQAEVEVMMDTYPEIRQEIDAIEAAMEQYTLNNALLPLGNVKDRILKQIGAMSTSMAEKATPLIPLNNTNYESKIRTLRFALVACLALLFISTAALFSTRNRLNNAEAQIETLSIEKEKFASTVNYMKQTNADLLKISDMSKDPDWKTVKLAGTKMDPKASMVIYWHITGNHVMMDNSKMELPANDSEHQYQLWALVNGKPVSLGVFDVQLNTAKILVNMKQITSAQTFAVTLEKRGGSPSPTMDQMIVAGNVSI